MDKIKEDNKHVIYRPTDKNLWTGRKTNSEKGLQYWYQAIQCIQLEKGSFPAENDHKRFALIGYVCDEGVRRNQGRIGAELGPTALRKSLGKVALHFENKSIFDVGDIVCIENRMEACQKRLSHQITELLEQNITPIAIGGGHDIAFAHFNGIYNYVKDQPKNKIGIINFDAHFDLRPIELQANSGTPFNQINTLLKEVDQAFNYFVVGIQPPNNTKELFDIAKDLKVDYVLHSDCEIAKVEYINNQLDEFISKVDHLYITVDLDGFSSAYVSGVSAPSPLGFAPSFFFKIFDHLLQSKKVISIDIAELNPTFDRDGQTANLASKIVDYTVLNR
ncbi:MAG: formimidoylglutamase [Chitinophagales bacterium]